MSVSPRRALIVIDVQNEYFTGNMPIEYPPVEISLPNILLAIETARANKTPVILVQHDAPEESPIFAKGSHGWQLHSAIKEIAADHHINKVMADVFAGTDLKQWLSANNIDTLAITGYMTHNCNASTIYHAAHEGYKVEYLSDATGALPYENAGGKASAEEIHRVFSTVFHSNFAAVATTQEWIGAVNNNAALEPDNVYVSNLRARSVKENL
ncbi:isochorismatase hydrolase [Cellvibrio sp. BR]|uniref:cysteine hydrolase family protein n=1 Tax=unclassified Cellvibrio TaxID=2624793 RepID=UPI0002600DD1|nr:MULTISPECIES: cysteine hydrolase family protein [unclassified Cellvibrio]EIK47053.1 isochorismatase hydrolase [Cellvibrio sp. BR]UUA71063.1 cysteine hydrolase [Cellvibrio sp. QJXJ]